MPFSIEDTKVEVKPTAKASEKEVTRMSSRSRSALQPDVENIPVVTMKKTPATRSKKGLSVQQPTSPESTHTSGSSDHSSLDNSTIRIPTQEIKEIIEQMPKIEVKERERGNKRKRVSFSGSGEQEVEQSRQKKMSRKETSSSSSSAPSSSSSSITSTGNSKGNIFEDKSKYFNLHGNQFVQLSVIGKGGSSSVHRVISATDGNIYALKKVDLSSHSSSHHNRGEEDEMDEATDHVLESYANEINLLNKLKNTSPFIIDLVDYEINRSERKIIMLLEIGDIDLAKLLSNLLKKSSMWAVGTAYKSNDENDNSSSNGSVSSQGSGKSENQQSLDPIFARMVWKEMLLAVNHIHEHRIVHG
jgi:hypothetical protein